MLNKIKKTTLIALAILLTSTVANAALSDYFVESDWVAANRDLVTIVDVRVLPLYLIGHIDGALHLDKSEFLEKRDGVKSLVPSAKNLEALLDAYGITPDTTVVAYAEDKNPYSARFVWSLRYHGHKKAYVLNGGYEKWASEDRSTAIFPTSPTPTSGYKVTKSTKIRAGADYILTRLDNPSVVVWDTRTPEEYFGTKVRADRGGHIPGASHLNWVDLQKVENGVRVLKNEAEILTLLGQHRITPDKEIIAHCQTGIRSSYATLVLLGLGYSDASNYDGSWIEWANNPTLPIENAEVASK